MIILIIVYRIILFVNSNYGSRISHNRSDILYNISAFHISDILLVYDGIVSRIQQVKHVDRFFFGRHEVYTR